MSYIERNKYIEIINKNRKRAIKGNEYIDMGEYYIGITSNNHTEFYIDKEDYQYAKNFTWYADNNGYTTSVVYQDVEYKRIYLHILVMDCIGSNVIIDHKDTHVNNNRKNNLRIVTDTENRMNTPVSKHKKSGLPKGITSKDGKYQVRIGHDYKQIYLGRYENLQDAVDAYNEKAIELYGEHAYIERSNNE